MCNSRRIVLALVLIIPIFAAPASDAAEADTGSGTVVVVLETTMGEIEIAVDLDRAPISAGDFLRYVDEGLYEGAAFYRVVRKDNDHGVPTIEVVQGGLVGDTETPAPVPHETTETTGIIHRDGVISLARGEPGTGSGAAFFICIGDQPSLDFGGMRNPDGLGFAAFGQVTRGMDLIRAIHTMSSDAPAPNEYVEGQLLDEPVAILNARRSD